ncbi:14931_t:CDS:2 [Funneliformis geosporum]|uniref:6980_t:CDS:1 n=1 Tax=Funneliformis geosporum TaxID=1117311 RepID=A0A9W4SJ18_9GLOM|nr:14931_t:CDS:2 [Funneliformis geosporum]CAI2170361.1 6980_t:CDS:2 [Funneliformis geosporum]
MAINNEQKIKIYKSKFDKIKSLLKLNLFSLAILSQFIVITLFQSELSFRNSNLNELLNIINNNCPSYRRRFVYMNFISFENYLFVAYQAFLTYLGLNSIFNQDVLQIRAYALMNFGGYIYTIIQMIEVKIPVEFARKACLVQIDSNIMGIELPQLITYTCFVMLNGYLSFKIYQPFAFVYFSVSFTSFMCAWNVKNDFGRGLKEAIASNKMKSKQLPNIQSIVIDDDEVQQQS